MYRFVVISIGAALALAGCNGAQPAEEEAAPALQAADFPELASSECVKVAQFYFEAISGREFDKAALVWDDPVVDGARLEAVFASYPEPEITWGDPFEEEGGMASQFCSITGVLTDAADPNMPAREGTLLLSRNTEAEGPPTPWRVESSTFIEQLSRSDRN
jgi:hypothetical protein